MQLSSCAARWYDYPMLPTQQLFTLLYLRYLSSPADNLRLGYKLEGTNHLTLRLVISTELLSRLHFMIMVHIRDPERIHVDLGNWSEYDSKGNCVEHSPHRTSFRPDMHSSLSTSTLAKSPGHTTIFAKLVLNSCWTRATFLKNAREFSFFHGRNGTRNDSELNDPMFSCSSCCSCGTSRMDRDRSRKRFRHPRMRKRRASDRICSHRHRREVPRE